MPFRCASESWTSKRWSLSSINKGSGVSRTINLSQASKDKSGVCDIAKSEGEVIEIIKSAENITDIKKKTWQ